MKKIITLIVVGIFISLTLSSSHAVDPVTTGKIVDNFKTQHEKILFESLPFTATGANEVLEYEYRMNGLEALKSRMAEVENYYAEKKSEATAERITLEEALKKLDDAILATEKSISETQTLIAQRQQKIIALEIASLELKKKIASHRKTILDYLANIYSEGNLIFNESGEVDTVKTLLLTSEDTDYYLQDMTYKAIASRLGQQFVDEYRQMVRDYYINGVKTKEEQVKLQNLQTDLENQNANYLTQKKEREQLLEITKGQEELFRQHVIAQQQAQKQIEEAWQKANDDYKKTFDRFLEQHQCSEDLTTDECKRLGQFFVNEAELAKSEYAKDTDNIFVWPSQSRRVTAYFRDPDYYKII